jgi:hypothetical protein
MLEGNRACNYSGSGLIGTVAAAITQRDGADHRNWAHEALI